MSISSLSGAAAAYPTAQTQQTHTPRYVQTAAKALGMNPADVMSALKSGKSLADLAKQQNVSVSDLTAALKAGAPKDVQGSSNVDAMMQKLVNQQGIAPHGHHGHGGTGAPSATGALTGTLTDDQQSTLTALSGLLGTDSNSLLTQLQSGTSLASLLDAKGVSTDALAASLQKGLLIDTQG